ncbi:MAG: WecB/TagA/CpsF family glycosyltransferase [Bacteroidales bacterium]|nr:WecB/TagA/CpsF family glycosyltransferase [Bacteroidales bacterium]
MKYNPKFDFYRVGKAPVLVTSQEDAANRVKELIRKGEKGYICISTMRTVVVANKEPKYLEVMENSLFNTPDGTPLVWCGRAWGIKQAERACGPHLFDDLLEDKDSSLKHFLLGDTEETEKKLKEKCEKEYGTQIVGMYSPPFAPLEEYDIQGIAKMINDSGANIVWTSLRAPKQDYLNAMLAPYVNDGVVLIGVGAAFRYKIGELKSPDGPLQKIGLAGLLFTRKGSIPMKEFKWYMKHSFYLLKYLIGILGKRIIGKKYYA